MIDGVFAGSAAAIFDERTAGGLFISNDGAEYGRDGIVRPRHGGWGSCALAMRIQNARAGVAAINNAQVMINRSVVASSVVGLFALGTAATEVNVSNSVISSNGTGVRTPAER